MAKKDNPGPITPRCLVGLSPETLKEVKELLEKQKGKSEELDKALDQLIKITDTSVDDDE
ncbi:hypothetical protein [uncultured Aquimarina sp.]|uniref:hypothetical protein n=1 Tax=uncultured Aquimarina sp. TaxID=575652 RepID=UPI0026072805|nr:hypothetical protein [uncultured Aquimarina sp.]